MSLANISTLNEVPPSTFRPNCSPFEYEFISQLKLADLPLFCQQNGLILGRRYDSGNVSLRCKYQSEGCPYLAYFASQFDAIYGIKSRPHNHHNIGNLEKNNQKLKPKIVPPSIFRPNCSPLEYEFISNMTLANLPLFCQQNGFTISDRYQSGNISLRCKHSGKSGCLYMAYFASQFDAIYGSKCRQHNHRIIGNLAKNKQTLKPTFAKKAKIDTNEINNWRCISHVKSRQEMDEISQKFGLNRTFLHAKKGQNFECKQHTKYRKTKERTKLADCGMRGILLNSNSCFYLIGKHNNLCNWANEEGEIGVNVNGIMEEPNGNERNMHNIADEMDEEQQDDEEDQADSRSCLGFEEMDEEHKSESEEDEPDYMDNKGKIWTFFANIQNEKELEQTCRKNGLTKNKTNNKTINYVCTARWSKNCQFRGIFIKINSCLYVANCHNHQLANSSGKK